MPNDRDSASITLPCPGKLNLALSVGAPRAEDGLHPISSWMATIDLCDELTIEPRADSAMTLIGRAWHEDAPVRSDLDWPLDQDLVARAHTAMERAAGQRLRVKATLRKRIPVGGGLGGGSSNAAAMLVGLNQLFALGFSADELENIAFTLGSDVAFFVRGGSAIVEGLGEQLVRVDRCPSFHAVIVMPDFGCPTEQVYQSFDRWGPAGSGHGGSAVDSIRVRELVRCAGRANVIDALTPLWNDLAFAACDVAPRLAGLLEELEELVPGSVHVTGSGSTLFALCPDEVTAQALAAHATTHLGVPVRAIRGPSAAAAVE
ncbi:MAG: 4-(cytidine 5'-diphospho)-2-C-methyl-D-erythritol kinase [Planctomycetota bacterium]|nr:4-(cytidine 5'-diphospho)-2-C-methyl-D-erythritol kinase [Planctomycetota bacterium]MDA1105916.1 4-(cytidine 5'-diphospho)-2-C-methyl-D-erythritol kinase [Planctomycetota bacterium]